MRAALTRKAYLFVGSDAGGRRAAIAYTIFASCRLAGVNPDAYLASVLPRLMKGGVTEEMATQLLPEFWRHRHPGET